MKASLAIEQLQQLVAKHGDGDIALAAIDTFEEFSSIQMVEEIKDDGTRVPCFAVFTAEPMTQYVESGSTQVQ